MKDIRKRKKSKIPFFILGNPRSGTSLLRLMLNSHPNIVVPPESGFLQWWYEKYKYWSVENSKDNFLVGKYVADILSSKKIEDWNLNFEKIINLILKVKPSNYGELSSLIYLSYNSSESLEEIMVGDKNNYFIHHLPVINEIYPNTKYIHLIRDGRDVACSYQKLKSIKTKSRYKPNLAYEIKDIAYEWRSNVNKIDTFLLNKEHLKINYENLLENTEETLLKLCDFLGVPYHLKMNDFYKPKINDEPNSTIDWKMKTLEPIDINNKSKYLDILSTHDISQFNIICEKQIIENGYDL